MHHIRLRHGLGKTAQDMNVIFDSANHQCRATAVTEDATQESMNFLFDASDKQGTPILGAKGEMDKHARV